MNRFLPRFAMNGSAVADRSTIRIAVDASTIEHLDGYRLTIRPDGIEVVGQSDAACFWGLQTVIQLVESASAAGNMIPCCRIEDWPDFATRGLLHDVSRGKVPTLDTLKRLADRLASWKINQLQLYIEHAFTFAFDPEICEPHDALTPDEIRELDRYCRERYIVLVPAVATLGHMGRILSMPKYRHLAEIEPQSTWSEMAWPERARGFTLDIANPESRKLVERIWSEIFDAFSSPVVNICDDEPWDLGKGKNKARFANGRGAEAYIEQIRWMCDLCAAQGRRPQAWSDVIKNHSELMDRLPRDLTILHWGYDDCADCDATAKFTRTGLQTIVCPGTSGWKRVLNAMNLAERNIQAFAAAGKKHGAVGLLNTDWGDHGHFNGLACSWHGIASGAALSWNADHVTGEKFDQLLSRQLFGDEGAAIFSDLREASRVADKCETWRLMWTPIRRVADDPMVPSVDLVRRCASAAEDAIDALQALGHSVNAVDDRAELALACRATVIFAEKVAAAQTIRRESGGVAMPDRSTRFDTRPASEIAESIDDLAHDYAAVWKRHNKLSGLWDILTALAAVASEFRVRSLTPDRHDLE